MTRRSMSGISATTHSSAVLMEECRLAETRIKADHLRALREAAESNGTITKRKRPHADLED